MKHTFHRYLLGSVVLAAMGFGQAGWSQQVGAHDNHTDHESHEVPDTAQDGDDAQSVQRPGGTGQGTMMQQRQGNGQGDMMQRMERMRAMMGGGQQESAQAGGQDAFSAIRAVVKQLEANPDTDWSQINITALRDHLVDMHEVTVNARVGTTEVAGGATYRVTGSGRTLEAIRHMVPTHAVQLTNETEWTAEAREIADGIEVTVTASSDDQVAKIRALGFMGFMVSGEHHEMHHMAIVGGDMDAMSAVENGGGGHSH